MSAPMAATYQPQEVEAKWSDWWEAKKFYSPRAEDVQTVPDSRKFVLVIPPPNVTGSLHLGHTLTNAIQDTLTRWHRMRGDVTLWVPGVDHAGIATQSIVERALLKNENLTRHDLGRKAFIDRVWEWKKKSGGHICYQLRRLGVSVDWTREAFTMNPMLSRAVIEAFVRLYDAGYIYRATRLVSWCPHLKTALSDIEVDTDEIDKPSRIRIPGYEKTVEVGMLWYFRYPIANDDTETAHSGDQWIEVGTTRLETMLGDVAVAVNPDDVRYKALVGKRLIHPFFPQREMRIIADPHVDVEFGTGAVKITPAHDKNDYDMGVRHSLPMINIFTQDGKINSAGGRFCGLHRFDCRVQLEKELTQLGLLTKKEANLKKMQLPRCSRSQDIVEYMLVPQWWMDCKAAAQKAVQAVKTGELDIVPFCHKQTWYYWLDNIRDWCISRQLWWGHRIPAYKVLFSDSEKPTQSNGMTSPSVHVDTHSHDIWIAARSEEEARERAIQKTGRTDFTLEQDEDVLDTWFSSALFPFSVFGWPENTTDFKAFFPTSLLETGHDILFFWVARMVMMSFLLLQKLPFRQVLLHAMVRDSHGKKMSKSLGNVVDPIEAIQGITLEEMMKKLEEGNLPEKEIARAKDAQKKDYPKGIPECGADALRYGLLAYTSQGRSVNLDVNRVVGYRFFCNKLWNATKFALMHFPQDFKPCGLIHLQQQGAQLEWVDRWILHRLAYCAARTNTALESFMFGEAVTATYNFWLYELCDIYLELLKPRLASLQTSTKPAVSALGPNLRVPLEVLFICLDWGLRLLHPMLPFVTEELYHRLPKCGNHRESISIADYPAPVIAWQDSLLDVQMDNFMGVVRQYRSLLAQLEVNPKERLQAYLIATPEPEEQAEQLAATSPSTFGIQTNAVVVRGMTQFFQNRAKDLAILSRLAQVTVLTGEASTRLPPQAVCAIVSDRIQIAVDAKGTVNLTQVLGKLEKKLGATDKQIDGYRKKMSIDNYLEKVPEEVRLQNDEKLKQLLAERQMLKQISTHVTTALSRTASASS